jgi:energy-coupling factor transporter ATP-binding protein EcfA2
MFRKCTCICGGPGSGKSTLMKQLIKDIPKEYLLLYDINNEHPELNRYGNDLPKIDDFIFQAHLSKNAIIICEEATIFFTSHNRTDEMLDLLGRRRHTGNGIILIFHSLRQVPDYMLSFINYLIILKTNGDTEDKIDRKFDNPDVLDAYRRINSAPWVENGPIRYSPHEIVVLG